MKILKKSLALFLVVALTASAFCLEAFASTRTKYGTYNGRNWGTKLAIGSFSVSGSIGYDGTSKDSVKVKWGIEYHDTYGDQYLAGTDIGTKTAKFSQAPGGRIDSASARYYIGTYCVNRYDYVTP